MDFLKGRVASPGQHARIRTEEDDTGEAVSVQVMDDQVRGKGLELEGGHALVAREAPVEEDFQDGLSIDRVEEDDVLEPVARDIGGADLLRLARCLPSLERAQVERGKCDVASVQDSIAIAVGSVSRGHLVGVRDGVPVAVGLGLVGHAVPIDVAAGPAGNVAGVEVMVPVSVGLQAVADLREIGEPMSIAIDLRLIAGCRSGSRPCWRRSQCRTRRGPGCGWHRGCHGEPGPGHRAPSYGCSPGRSRPGASSRRGPR